MQIVQWIIEFCQQCCPGPGELGAVTRRSFFVSRARRSTHACRACPSNASHPDRAESGCRSRCCMWAPSSPADPGEPAQRTEPATDREPSTVRPCHAAVPRRLVTIDRNASEAGGRCEGGHRKSLLAASRSIVDSVGTYVVWSLEVLGFSPGDNSARAEARALRQRRDRLSTCPERAPTGSPPRTATVPFTITVEIPVG